MLQHLQQALLQINELVVMFGQVQSVIEYLPEVQVLQKQAEILSDLKR